MNEFKLRDVRRETMRFIKKVDTAIKKLEDDRMAYLGCKETSACRRASLDLTRALAELRK